MLVIGDSKFEVVSKDDKLFVKHTFNGKYFSDEDYMMIYGLKSKPYIKRMGEKMYLPKELLNDIA